MKNKILLYALTAIAITAIIWVPIVLETKSSFDTKEKKSDHISGQEVVFVNNKIVFKDEEIKQKFNQTGKLYLEDSCQIIENTTLVFDESRNLPKLTDEPTVDGQFFYNEQKNEELKQISEMSDQEDIKLFPFLSDLISIDNGEQFKMVEALNAQYGEKIFISVNDINVTTGSNLVLEQIVDDSTFNVTTTFYSTYLVGDNFFDIFDKLLTIVESETEDQKNRNKAIDEAKRLLKSYGKRH